MQFAHIKSCGWARILVFIKYKQGIWIKYLLSKNTVPDPLYYNLFY